MINQSKKIFFPNLDALRFIAFLFVFCEHIFWGAFKKLPIHDKPMLKSSMYNLLCNGGLGVSIFFVLSGFLITYLILMEINMNGKLDVKAFYIRRSLRIWPLYYMVLLFIFVLYPFVQHLLNIYQANCARPVFYFLFLSNFDLINIARTCYNQGTVQSGVTWSIAIEEQFYFVWPLLFYFLPRQFYKYCFFAIILVSIFFRFLHYNDASYIYFHTLGVVGDLAAGALVAYYSLNSQRFKDFFENLKPLAIYTVYAAGLLFILFSNYFISSPYLNAWARYVNVMFFCFLLMHQNFSTTNVLKLHQLNFFTKWGKYTYGLYLLHPIGLIIGSFIFKKIYHGTDSFLVSFLEGIGVFIITLTLAYFSYHWFESYFLKLKNKFSYITKN